MAAYIRSQCNPIEVGARFDWSNGYCESDCTRDVDMLRYYDMYQFDDSSDYGP